MTQRFKHPRTPHAPQSMGRTSDDIGLKSMNHFLQMNEIVVLEKMDGENFVGYADGYSHARSIDGRHHSSRDWAKAFWAQRAADLPEEWRIGAENLYAKHAIHYDALQSYIMGFAVWNHDNVCLSWPETIEWFQLLDIVPVPELYRGPYDQKIIDDLVKNQDINTTEGFVIRNADAFSFDDFGMNVAKIVRPNHVAEGSDHWAHQMIVPNKLKIEADIGQNK